MGKIFFAKITFNTRILIYYLYIKITLNKEGTNNVK